MDLSRAATYRLEPSADGNDLSVVFDEQAAESNRRHSVRTRRQRWPPLRRQPRRRQPHSSSKLHRLCLFEGAPRQFTGTPVSLDFDGTDLRAVLTALAKEGGINLYIDPRVTGTVTTTLTDLPWDEAFDLIATSNGLGYVAARLGGPCRAARRPRGRRSAASKGR